MSILWDFFTVLPARAGVILRVGALEEILKSTTRTSGGDPIFRALDYPLHSYYPHERG